ncbi:metal-sensitive transcriptional regulator [Microbacterium sp. 3H14]|uniref:metal-sensitive transcriptional regulator n=1 Tax=unclassified Microbacterium TaxID=2609290 RepID=UPI00106C4F84|nr:metal-sensitive transcriptional regulator [Microbacterium sp. 3H14]TFB16798.1 metal-sensitive transcriptional regulator [Microbacterium sp. 3H14]
MSSADAETQRKIANRLKRAQGQLGAVIAAVERGSDCRAVVTQLAAVTSALDKAGFQIIASAMQDCLTDPASETDSAIDTDGVSMAELEKLFLSLA